MGEDVPFALAQTICEEAQAGWGAGYKKAIREGLFKRYCFLAADPAFMFSF